MVARNILLAEMTGAHVHCQHVSAAGSVKLLREARKRGVPVSGEACPHHFTLTDAALAGSEKFLAADGNGVFGLDAKSGARPAWPAYDTNFKMNPPLARRATAKPSSRVGGWHAGDSVQRPRAALRLRERRGIRLCAVWHHGLETELALSLMQLITRSDLRWPI